MSVCLSACLLVRLWTIGNSDCLHPSRMFQNIPECSKRFQNSPEGSRRFKNAPGFGHLCTRLNQTEFVTHLWTIHSQLRQLWSPQPITSISAPSCFEWPIRDRNQPTRGCHLHLVPLTFKLAYPLLRLSLVHILYRDTLRQRVNVLHSEKAVVMRNK